MTNPLAPDRVRFYRENGYLAVEGIYSHEEIEELRAVTDDFVERSRSVTTSDDTFDLEPAHTPDRPLLRRLKQPVERHEAYRRTLRKPALLDIVEALIGRGIRSDSSKLNMKTAGAGSPVEWHQDWAFYPHTNDDLLAVGVYLDDSTQENGALMVLPGSHRGPILDHHQDGHFVGAVTDPAFETAGAVPLEVGAGGITIHHARTLHGSAPNRSGRPRRLLLFQFCANDAWPLADALAGDAAWASYCAGILRGEPVLSPRMEAVPVRLPLPEPLHKGSIYESQKSLQTSRFAGA